VPAPSSTPPRVTRLVLGAFLSLASCVGPAVDPPRFAPPGEDDAAETDADGRAEPRPAAQGDPWLAGVSPSFLPNLGLTGTLARELVAWRGSALAVELEATQQSLDDTSFTDSDNPSAGDWTQGKLGLRWAFPFDDGRWFTLRTGGVWFRARGRPNVINDADDYAGAYVELGLEARFGERWIVGPAVSTMLVYDETDREEHVVPQVTWRFLYVF